MTHITHDATDPDAWHCLCGNTPTADGFVPCDAAGHEVAPTPSAWTTDTYLCTRCGRMIDPQSLEVVGQVQAVHSPAAA